MILPAATGVLTWTLIEYVFHRWLGHDRRFTSRNGFGTEHVKHHADGNHFARPWKKVVFFALAAAVVVPPAVLAAGVTAGLAFSGAVLASYLVYEVTHRRMHTAAPRGPYGRLIRRLHFHHHFHDVRGNYGVTSPLWDLLLGTWRAPSRFGRVVVPARVAMPWLVDAHGAPDPRHAADYALRGDPRAVPRRPAPPAAPAPPDDLRWGLRW